MLTIPRLSGPRGVYALTHVASGTCYVGASRRLMVRFFTHQELLMEGTHYNQALQADWNTYGPDAFTFTVLDYIEDSRDLFMAERQWKQALPRLYNPLETPRHLVTRPATVARIGGDVAEAEPEAFVHMDVRHTRHTAYQIVYHLVWCPKDRRPVRTGDVSDRLVELIQEIVLELGGEIIEVVVRPDHVHLFGHFPPTLATHQIMACIKGKTSHTLRHEFPSLRSRLPSLWTSAYDVGTAGSMSSETIRKYIEAQKDM